MRKATITIVGLVAMVALVVWFAGGLRPRPSAHPTVRVIGEDYSPMQGLEKIKDGFTKETGVAVDITRLDAETLRKRYVAELQTGGAGMDVVMGAFYDVGLLASNGWVLNLDQALARPGWRDARVEMSNFSNAVLNLCCRYQDHLYALPCSAQTMFLWYRSDLFGDAGEQQRFKAKYGYALPQPTPTQPMTLKQYRDVAEFFTRRKGETAASVVLKDNLYGTVLQAKNHVALWFEFLNFLHAFHGGLVSADGTRVTAAEGPLEQALAYYVSLKPFAPPGTTNYTWDDALSAFQNGQVAMAIMWSDSIVAVEDSKSSRIVGRVAFGANPVLKDGDKPASVFGGWGLFVNSRSKEPEAAAKFVQWANRPDVQVEWAKVGGIPASLSTYSSPELSRLPGAPAQREALQHAVGWSTAPYSARMIEVGQNVFARVAAGALEPKEGAAELQSRLQQILGR